MTPAIVFPNPEAWAVDYLTARIPGVTFGVADAGTGPRRVLIRRDGGLALGPATDSARLTVRVFAESEVVAHDLALRVHAFLRASVGIGPVRAVGSTSGPSYVPDPTGPLYLFTCELVFRGSPLTV